MRNWAWLLALPLLGACAAPRPAPLQLQHRQASLMHTLWDLELVCRDSAEADRLSAQAATLVEGLDQRLALWKPASELAQLNAAAGAPQRLTVSADLAACLGQALRTARASGGALDPTVGPLTRAWWQARQEKRLLRPDEVAAGRALLGLDRVELETGPPARARLAGAGMQLDLGAVAKGYAQDRVAAWLESQGVHAFLLNAGGQVYARGRKPDGSPWRVGIEHPRDPGRVAAVLALEDAALSTSGDYEQVSIIQGQRVHHILDPRTGRSVKGMASASALLRFKPGDPDAGVRADAASTAAFVLGPIKGLAFLKRQGMEGLLISEDAQGLHPRLSPGLKGLDVVVREP